MGIIYNTKIVRDDSLVIYLDSFNKKSYPGTGNIWYDLSGKGNNATLENVTMNQRAYFNGTNSRATIQFNANDFTFDYAQTIILVLSPQESDTTRRNPYNQAYGGGGTWTHETNNTISSYVGTAGSNTTPYTQFNSDTLVQFESAFMGTTRISGGKWKWFKNGVKSWETNNPYTQVVTGTSNILIGYGYAGYYLGYIDTVMVYNRELSEEEMYINFNSIRKRYSI